MECREIVFLQFWLNLFHNMYLEIMYLPELENFTSEILEMISEKKDLLVGSSGSSNILVWLSQRADWNKNNWGLCSKSLPDSERYLPHVTQSYGSLAGAVHE